jgi:phage nucleotide-binding protein
MPLQIQKPDQLRFLKALIHAPGGAGKTVLMGTAQLDERMAPFLVLDFEGGVESLAGLDIDIAPIRSWQDYNEAYELLASGDHNYKGVGIDSISETHKFALLDILRDQGPSRNDPQLLEQRDYGKATVQMRQLLRAFRDLPMHVIFSAHTKEIEIAREGRVRVPDLAGQMAEEVAGLMSVVGYLAQFEEDGELHRTLLLHGFQKFRIKARTPWGVEAPEEIIDPSITSLLDALHFGDSQNGTPKTLLSSRGKQKDQDVGPSVEEKVEEELKEEENGVGPVETEAVEDGYEDMSYKVVKDLAKERELDLTGARTKPQIIAVLREADAGGVAA